MTRRRAPRKRVLILGGGFAGLAAALEIDAERHEVTLVDRRAAFEFLPNIHELLSGVKTPELLRLPLDRAMQRRGHRFLLDAEVRPARRAARVAEAARRGAPDGTRRAMLAVADALVADGPETPGPTFTAAGERGTGRTPMSTKTRRELASPSATDHGRTQRVGWRGHGGRLDHRLATAPEVESMFVWCAYCQTVMSEKPPYYDTRSSHSICARCESEAEQGTLDPVFDERRVEFFRRLLGDAVRGDLGVCRERLEEGLALGLPAPDLVLAAVQFVLYDIGTRWECGEASVADEHRATLWCETLLAYLPLVARGSADPSGPGGPLDLLGFVEPDNTHTVGPRLAECFLDARGMRTRVVVPGLPRDEVLRAVEAERPRGVAFSVALPDGVPRALELCDALRGAGYEGSLFVTGPAVRRPEAEWASEPRVAPTLWDIAERLELDLRPDAVPLRPAARGPGAPHRAGPPA